MINIKFGQVTKANATHHMQSQQPERRLKHSWLSSETMHYRHRQSRHVYKFCIFPSDKHT